MKSILITGCSTGIGYASARVLTENGYRVFASVRKEADAEKLRLSLGGNCHPLVFDVSDQKAIDAAVVEVQNIVKDEGLYGLFNNAGIALMGPLLHQPLEEIEQTLQTNVMGLLRVTRAFLPLLGARENCPHPPGRILNMSSIGGRLSMPFIGTYCASKHSVEALSNSLRCELMLYGIDVSILEPGAVVTPIWDKAPDPEDTGYQQTGYQDAVLAFLKSFADEAQKGLPPAKVGRLVHKIFTSKRPKIRYIITPTPFVDKFLLRFLPTRMIDSMLGKEFKLRPSSPLKERQG